MNKAEWYHARKWLDKLDNIVVDVMAKWPHHAITTCSALTVSWERTLNANDDRLLLVLPLLAHSINGRVYTDTQACNGLRLWLKNFPNITLACPTDYPKNAPPQTSPIDAVEGIDRLTFVPLPVAYTPVRFFANLPEVIRLLNEQIARANYLHFAIGGLWGDWASIATLLASRSGLPFAVWTDRVQSQATEFQCRSLTGLRYYYLLLTAKLMVHYERYIIKRCALGLFHGMDCFRAYSAYCSNPHLVHDVHLQLGTLITPAALTERLLRSSGSPLRLTYAGRVDRDKGVYDWIEALSLTAEAGVDFTATWFGSGPELLAARECVCARGLSSSIKFPGATDSHVQLIRELQRFDVFVFCHKTLESPRCLVEALHCGLPIVGYESNFPSDLIRIHGGGLLTPKDDTRALSNSLVQLSRDRTLLRDLSERAAQDGAPLTDEQVFQHRSELMKSIRIGPRC